MQNCGPFYGFALGDFPSRQGGISVECSARLVAVMNTKNRLGRVGKEKNSGFRVECCCGALIYYTITGTDGRYPHWVNPYDESSERYSLIYYETGNNFIPPGPAVFSIPKRTIDCA